MPDLFATITAADEIVMVQRHPGESEALFVERAMRPAPVTRARTHLPACNVLALDLATRCGWAYGLRDGKQRSGAELFLPGRCDHNGQRWLLMRQWLGDIAREMGSIEVVYFEDVKRHVSNLSARVYFGYLAILEAWCKTNNVRLVGVGVGTVKKHWTGAGNADKPAMIREAKRRGFSPRDDNEADALAILSFAVKQEQ